MIFVFYGHFSNNYNFFLVLKNVLNWRVISSARILYESYCPSCCDDRENIEVFTKHKIRKIVYKNYFVLLHQLLDFSCHYSLC